MSWLKNKLHRLIDRMSEPEIKTAWEYLENFYYDNLMLEAIEKAKRSQQPGDTLTRDEAIQILHFDYEDT